MLCPAPKRQRGWQTLLSLQIAGTAVCRTPAQPSIALCLSFLVCKKSWCGDSVVNTDKVLSLVSGPCRVHRKQELRLFLGTLTLNVKFLLLCSP